MTILKGKGGHNFHIFFGGTNLKLIKIQKKLLGVRGHAPPENFENLHAVMTIFVLFQCFLAKFCLKFLTLILSALPNTMHFVRTLSIMRGYGVKFTAILRARNYGKIVYIKNIFENSWWEDAFPLSYAPRPAPGHKQQKPSKESGIFQSLGTINFVHFY